MKMIFLALIKFYRYCLSPLMGNNCRYYPSCSCYAEEAISRFGAVKGGWMALCRICRCHPWHEGGVDLVPDNKNSK